MTGAGRSDESDSVSRWRGGKAEQATEATELADNDDETLADMERVDGCVENGACWLIHMVPCEGSGPPVEVSVPAAWRMSWRFRRSSSSG